MTGRRDFLRATSAAAVAGPLLRGAVASATRPKRVAIIAPSWRPGSRTQDLGDRLLVGYPYAGVWQRPAIELAALYVARPSGGDLSAVRAAEFGFHVYPSIGEALRCGGQELAVDAVLLTGGADDPPGTSQPQQTESRRHLFRQIVDVFQQSGQSRPTFNNEQLGADWETAREMVETSRRLGFALLAGSPLPVTWRLPALELPLGCVIEEALLVGGAAQPADYRALEALQCMVERRRGGETGIASLQSVRRRRGMARGVRRPLVPHPSGSGPLPLRHYDGRQRPSQGPGQQWRVTGVGQDSQRLLPRVRRRTAGHRAQLPWSGGRLYLRGPSQRDERSPVHAIPAPPAPHPAGLDLPGPPGR